MLSTRTGNFPIGFRRGWSEWQKDLPTLIEWSKENGLSVIDVGESVADAQTVTDAGLRVGSADLPNWSPLISPDEGKRANAVAENNETIAALAAAGAKNFFFVALPENAELPRSENFGYLTESLNALSPALEKAGANIIIEGWPGAGALSCTPEGYRAVFKECASQNIAVNYDPSHLLRMGIDPLRFLEEFVSRVRHVHGKDTEILTERLYEYGTEQPATFGTVRPYGGMAWRYTIPGHGQTNWLRVFEILQNANYQGAVCIELEDDNFNDKDEQRGILSGAQFLSGC